MDHVEGEVPADNLPYTMEGWVIDATPRATGVTWWWSGVDALAAVHRADWRHGSRPRVAGGRFVRAPGIGQEMAYYRRFLDWAAPDLKVPVIESTWQWLLEHQPTENGEVVLSWGDSRIGNVIWRDFEAVAVIDWEMASLGQPEMDLGWWLYFDRQFSDGLGVARPAGFGSHADTIERYAELMGRPMRDLFFYEIFSGFRFAVVMLRLSDLLMGSDVPPQDSDMGTNNLATQLLATMLELPAPAWLRGRSLFAVPCGPPARPGSAASQGIRRHRRPWQVCRSHRGWGTSARCRPSRCEATTHNHQACLRSRPPGASWMPPKGSCHSEDATATSCIT